MRTRFKRVEIQLSDEEYSSAKASAQSRKMMLARYIRTSICEGIPPAIPTINLSALAELQRIGNNINQIARAFNTSGSLHIEDARKEIAALKFVLIEARKQ